MHAVDRSPDFVDAFASAFADVSGATWELGDLGDAAGAARAGHAFVAPANSFLEMSAGADLALRRRFPGMEARAQAKVAAIAWLTTLRRPYLPVGSAIALAVPYRADTLLTAAPTMFVPQDVSDTRNAYHAFLAAMCATAKRAARGDVHVHTVVVPGLCCGFGRMPAAAAAAQMREAWDDFVAGRHPRQVMRAEDPEAFLVEPRDMAEPRGDMEDDSHTRTFAS